MSYLMTSLQCNYARPRSRSVEQESTVIQEAQYDEMTGVEISPAISIHNVKAQENCTNKGKVTVENVPPEEFLISKRARTISDSPFTAHRKMMTR
jgi:hypothetical protein